MLYVLDAIILFLLLIVPGFIAERLFKFISRCKAKSAVISALIFNFLIILINITGLFFFKNVNTIQDLLSHFIWMHFCMLYGLLSILVAIILGVIFGIISRFVYRRFRITD